MADDRTTAYAEALFAVARAEGPLAEIEDELFRVAQVVRGNDELRDKLADPHIPVATRQQVVFDLLDGKAQPATTNLVSLVVGNGRVRELPAIVDALVAMTAREANKEVAEVRSAIALTDDQKARLAEALGQATGKQVEVKVIVDPSIKGGLVAQVGDTVIDMAELTINIADITAAIQKNLEGFTPTSVGQVGRVLEVGDGIARVSGLPDAPSTRSSSSSRHLGLALNLDEDSIGAVVLGEVDDIEEGQTVKATGQILSVPVGDGLLGRVVNTLGEPIDGKGPTPTSRIPPRRGPGARHHGPPARARAACRPASSRSTR
jgi:F-type H+-transporting ATPase subunit delta